MLREELQKERETLDKIIAKAAANLTDAPEGRLRISSSHGTPQYLSYTGTTRTSSYQETYIKKDDADLVRQLAQKDYDERMLRAAQAGKDALETLADRYLETGLDAVRAIYAQLGDRRRELVTPYALTDAEFEARWRKEAYETLGSVGCETFFETDRGEKVRSKSELIIANKLAAAGIPYRYECKLPLGPRSVYPDFTILNTRTRETWYWEHFGLMDDGDYLNRTLSKIELYARNGIVLGKHLVATFESSSKPFDAKTVDAYIQILFA